MTTAGAVAIELRKLADALDKEPEANVQNLWLTFYCDDKDLFLQTVKLLPRPLVKEWDQEDDRWDRLHVRSRDVEGGSPVQLDCSVLRFNVCRLIVPAQDAIYECEPLLSEADEASLV